MPDVTPIYTFPYPCLDESIDAAHFTALANAIDAKLLEVQADATAALLRPQTTAFAGTQVGIAAGVETVIALAGSQLVVPTAGIYLSYYIITPTNAGNVSSSRIRVRRNGVFQYGQTFNNQDNLPHTFSVPAMPIICAAGDTISAAYLFQGTATATVSVGFSSRMLVRIA